MHSPAFTRNKEPILDALRQQGIESCERVLELWSGPGEHAPYFAEALGGKSPVWQPTDFSREA